MNTRREYFGEALNVSGLEDRVEDEHQCDHILSMGQDNRVHKKETRPQKMKTEVQEALRASSKVDETYKATFYV